MSTLQIIFYSFFHLQASQEGQNMVSIAIIEILFVC